MLDNLLYYGDNLDVLRRHVKDESVDLVYLDPPAFNRSANNGVGVPCPTIPLRHNGGRQGRQ